MKDWGLLEFFQFMFIILIFGNSVRNCANDKIGQKHQRCYSNKTCYDEKLVCVRNSCEERKDLEKELERKTQKDKGSEEGVTTECTTGTSDEKPSSE